ncbi:MAG: hypothetical protein VX368_02850 [Thermoproteota archaeon]
MTSTENSKIISLGIGTFGCNILSKLEFDNLQFDSYNYISCDQTDLESISDNKLLINLNVGGKTSRQYFTKTLMKYKKEIESILKDKECVFLFGGLGGYVGSYLIPFIAEMCHNMNVKCYCIIAMPFDHEKTKHFRAGLSFQRLKKYSDGTIIIDNDEIMNNFSNIPLFDTFQIINSVISSSLSRILGAHNKNGTPIDIHKLVDVIGSNDQSIMSISESESDFNQVTNSTIKNIKSLHTFADPSEVKKVLFFIESGKNITPNDIYSSVNTIQSNTNSNSTVEFGYSIHNSNKTKTIMLSSGLTSSKFDKLDPLNEIFGGKNLDCIPESTIDVNLHINDLD